MLDLKNYLIILANQASFTNFAGHSNILSITYLCLCKFIHEGKHVYVVSASELDSLCCSKFDSNVYSLVNLNFISDHCVSDYFYINISSKYILVFQFCVTLLYVFEGITFFLFTNVFPLCILCSFKIFTFGGIVGLLILLPINCLGTQLRDNSEFQNKSLDSFSISNVNNGSNRWVLLIKMVLTL